MSESHIKLLPDHVANQIAAGEVVQRPASVVKELMENAIDAEAGDIKLIVKDGGKTLIQVVDNGKGMNPVDARMAFERHATSKIAQAEDLFQINTKGFRGEALASIAAVAHVEMKTKTEDEELGTYIKIEGSKVVQQEPVATPTGTSIAVKNLFFNIPARRKFLKSIQVEMRHINDEFFRLALAHPGISFSLIHNGNIIYQLPKSNHLQRINQLFGKKIKEKLVPVQEETDYIKISGYIGKPEFAKLKRGEQYFFVNKRFVKSSYLHHALMSAYEGLIKEKSFPSYFIYFEIDPKHIDVNIHPTKTEIKFDDEPTVYSILKVAAKHSLGQFNVAPSMDFDARPDLEVPYEYTKKTPKIPEISVDPDFNPFLEDDFGQPAKTSPKYYEKKLEYWETLMHQSQIPNDNDITPQTEITGFESGEKEEKEIIFQLKNKYIVTRQAGNLIFIHQHRAHTQILFYELFNQLKNGHIASQQLIFPVEIKLNNTETDSLKNYENELIKMGFDIDFNDGKIMIKGVPYNLNTGQINDIIQKILEKLTSDTPVEPDELTQQTAYLIAERSAVKTGQKLQAEEMENIIEKLFKLPQQNYTGKGKKIIVELPFNEIENRF